MRIGLEQHVEARHGAALARVFGAVAGAAREIEARLRTAPLSGALGALGQTNVQGEQQQKLDVFANDVLMAAMRALPGVAAAVSEEDAAPVVFAGREASADGVGVGVGVGEGVGEGEVGEFVVLFDPLDGSSNLDVDVNVGTIVSVQRVLAGQGAEAAALQRGRAQVAALYVNYGPATMLVYAAGAGVHCFTLADGEFVLSAEGVRMPERGPYYSVNEGNVGEFPAVYREYLEGLRDGSLLGQGYSARYVGSFIADFHRTLLKGGVFLYPPTRKAPGGKLRLLYEANPLALIAEEAGGMATTGLAGEAARAILDVVPGEPHERTTLVIGSRVEVGMLGVMLAGAVPAAMPEAVPAVPRSTVAAARSTLAAGES